MEIKRERENKKYGELGGEKTVREVSSIRCTNFQNPNFKVFVSADHRLESRPKAMISNFRLYKNFAVLSSIKVEMKSLD